MSKIRLELMSFWERVGVMVLEHITWNRTPMTENGTLAISISLTSVPAPPSTKPHPGQR